MNERIRHLMEQIHRLEDELTSAIREHETPDVIRIVDKPPQFEYHVLKAHRNLRVNLMRWLGASQFRNVMTAPLVYLMIVPLLMLDAFLLAYQAACFPLYRIARPRRGDFISFDRGRLEYLNLLERMNCNYCAYANGLLSYAREVAVRTEQYWCPIKHAHRLRGTHTRHARFSEYGDAENYQRESRRLRRELMDEGGERR